MKKILSIGLLVIAYANIPNQAFASEPLAAITTDDYLKINQKHTQQLSQYKKTINENRVIIDELKQQFEQAELQPKANILEIIEKYSPEIIEKVLSASKLATDAANKAAELYEELEKEFNTAQIHEFQEKESFTGWGKMHGKTEEEKPYTISGYFIDGILNGVGKRTVDTSEYFGEFESNMRHGFGIINSMDLNHASEWINDIMHGYGTMKHLDAKYEGEVKNYKSEGFGRQNYDGEISKGKFQNGRFKIGQVDRSDLKKKEKMIGQFDRLNRQYGQGLNTAILKGKISFESGVFYNGELIDGFKGTCSIDWGSGKYELPHYVNGKIKLIKIAR